MRKLTRMAAESVDLIYFDPPDLMTGKHTGFGEFRLKNSDTENLQFVARVCQHAHRMLKPTGVLFFHAQPISVFSVRLILSQIFGEVLFRDEFVWHPGQAISRGPLSQVGNTIRFFTTPSPLNQPATRSSATRLRKRPKERPNGAMSEDRFL